MRAAMRVVGRGVLVVAGFALAVALRADGQTPEKKCDDPVPSVCLHAKYLGTEKGCSCFVCNPDDRQKRAVVCTKKEADKRTLFGKVDPAARPVTPARVPDAGTR